MSDEEKRESLTARLRALHQRLELFLESGAVPEKELADPHKAIECYLNAIALDEGNRTALVAAAPYFS